MESKINKKGNKMIEYIIYIILIILFTISYAGGNK